MCRGGTGSGMERGQRLEECELCRWAQGECGVSCPGYVYREVKPRPWRLYVPGPWARPSQQSSW